MTRALLLPSPGVGHVFPLVPSAWALRGAGVDVLVGTTGGGVAAAAEAGLPVVDVSPDVDLEPVRTGFLRRMPGRPDGERFALAMEMFAAIADAMVDGAAALARAWRPDVVVHTPLQIAGPLVAAALGVPCVEHGFQLTGVGRTQHLLAPHTDAARARLGVDRLPAPALALDVCPPSMLLGPARGTVVGYRPYNGGRAVDPALAAPPRRPRVVVTVGTSLPGGPRSAGPDVRLAMLEALAGEDVDVLLAGEPPPGPLPANATAPGWVPLDVVLPGAAALVHHGGAGSTLTALWAGTPQVVAPQQADHEFNAAAVHRRGVGVRSSGDLGPAVAAVLGSAAVRRAAAEVAREVAGLPGPARVLPTALDRILRAPSTGPGAGGPTADDAQEEVA